jgi:hypothetical protein
VATKNKASEMMCSMSWIDTFMLYTAQQESPENFKKWVAISMIAGVLGRNMWLEIDSYRKKMYPNLYTILCASTSLARKSTIVSIGMDMLNQMQNTNILDNKLTSKSTIFKMISAKNKSHFIYLPDFYLGCKDLEYLLVSIFDNPLKWIVHSSGEELTIKNTTLNVLSTSTENFPVDIFLGLKDRCIFVKCKLAQDTQIFPEYPRNKKLKFVLLHDLARISELKGAAFLSKEAKKYYENWFTLYNSKVPDRRPDHLLKVALILTISDIKGQKSRGPVLVKLEHIMQADALLKETDA